MLAYTKYLFRRWGALDIWEDMRDMAAFLTMDNWDTKANKLKNL